MIELTQTNGFFIYLEKENGRPIANPLKRTHIIRNNGALLPYLTIKQQLLSSIPSKHMTSYKHLLTHWLHYFRLQPNILDKHPKEISTEDLLLINLLHLLSQRKSLIVFEDSLPSELERFWQEIAGTLDKIAKQEDIQIILLTKNKHFTEENQAFLMTI